ncbi:MAG TPA: hypothetical protein VMH87_14530 [Pseudomonadales bacterium]|nr:hypothetical protein [Pseudomonadales bacterium]
MTGENLFSKATKNKTNNKKEWMHNKINPESLPRQLCAQQNPQSPHVKPASNAMIQHKSGGFGADANKLHAQAR